MLNKSWIRNLFISLVVAVLAPVLLSVLNLLGEQASQADLFAVYAVSAVLLLLATSLSERLRLSAACSGRKRAASRSFVTADGKDTREEGIVKWFNVNKGFGFIIRDNGGEVFVHFRSIRGTGHRTLREGQRVRFVAVDGDKGLQAEDVSPL